MKTTLAMLSILLAANAFGADWIYEYLEAEGHRYCLAAKDVTEDFEQSSIIALLIESEWRNNRAAQIAIPALTTHVYTYTDEDSKCPTDILNRSFGCDHTYTTTYGLDDAEWEKADFGSSLYHLGRSGMRLFVLPPTLEKKLLSPTDPEDEESKPPSTLAIYYESRTHHSEAKIKTAAFIDLAGLVKAYEWIGECADKRFQLTPSTD